MNKKNKKIEEEFTRLATKDLTQPEFSRRLLSTVCIKIKYRIISVTCYFDMIIEKKRKRNKRGSKSYMANSHRKPRTILLHDGPLTSISALFSITLWAMEFNMVSTNNLIFVTQN